MSIASANRFFSARLSGIFCVGELILRCCGGGCCCPGPAGAPPPSGRTGKTGPDDAGDDASLNSLSIPIPIDVAMLYRRENDDGPIDPNAPVVADPAWWAVTDIRRSATGTIPDARDIRRSVVVTVDIRRSTD